MLLKAIKIQRVINLIVPCIFAYHAVAALVIVLVTMESSGGDEIVDPSLILQPPERCNYKDFLIA